MVVPEPDNLNADVPVINKVNQVDQDVPTTKQLRTVSINSSIVCDSHTALHCVILFGGSLMCTSRQRFCQISSFLVSVPYA
jgi:hypothetical protein